MSVFAYPQPGKAKSRRICRAFAEGCGGSVIEDGKLRDGPAMFYGVAPGMESLWHGAQDGRDYFYADNAFFDSCREQYFRIGKGRLQHDGAGTSDGHRLTALGVRVAPWRTAGAHIVVCQQSDHFMRSLAGYDGNWMEDTIAALRRVTSRPIRMRPWLRNKSAQSATLAADLVSAHALVTWSSAAAVNALVAGIPVVCAVAAAAACLSTPLDEIETPRLPDGRRRLAAVLADNQWTLAEIRAGVAWLALQ